MFAYLGYALIRAEKF
ncbi:potassium-transporting ATPase subunit F [Pseudomonas sp. NPDC098740]|nr:potassium-transporting ATPase subunit F [Pseudomonas lurida]